jgi:ketosteroid isomerase-like protein
MKKIIFLFALMGYFTACQTPRNSNRTAENQKQIAAMLDSFHIAAAQADFDRYFDFFTEDAVFIGTDATEHWDKKAFKAFAKPYFDKGKAWNFKALNRHIYLAPSGEMAWFDELLNTQMKICRGSGVLVRVSGNWKVQQYVLSTTIPNALMDSVVHIKAKIEDGLIRDLQD